MFMSTVSEFTMVALIKKSGSELTWLFVNLTKATSIWEKATSLVKQGMELLAIHKARLFSDFPACLPQTCYPRNIQVRPFLLSLSPAGCAT